MRVGHLVNILSMLLYSFGCEATFCSINTFIIWKEFSNFALLYLAIFISFVGSYIIAKSFMESFRRMVCAFILCHNSTVCSSIVMMSQVSFISLGMISKSLQSWQTPYILDCLKKTGMPPPFLYEET